MFLPYKYQSLLQLCQISSANHDILAALRSVIGPRRQPKADQKTYKDKDKDKGGSLASLMKLHQISHQLWITSFQSLGEREVAAHRWMVEHEPNLSLWSIDICHPSLMPTNHTFRILSGTPRYSPCHCQWSIVMSLPERTFLRVIPVGVAGFQSIKPYRTTTQHETSRDVQIPLNLVQNWLNTMTVSSKDDQPHPE